MGKQTIKEALGLGEVITFSDGTQLPCVPASLADLEDAMAHWSKSLGAGLPIQAIFMPGNEEAKEAFKELLVIATGRRIPIDELMNKIRISKEVATFIDRFLGFEPRATGTEETTER